MCSNCVCVHWKFMRNGTQNHKRTIHFVVATHNEILLCARNKSRRMKKTHFILCARQSEWKRGDKIEYEDSAKRFRILDTLKRNIMDERVCISENKIIRNRQNANPFGFVGLSDPMNYDMRMVQQKTKFVLGPFMIWNFWYAKQNL